MSKRSITSEASAMSGKAKQRWSLTLHGHSHRVEVHGTVLRTIRWYLDDVLVATLRSVKGNVSLEARSVINGVIEVELGFGRPAGRATLFEDDDDMLATQSVATGTGGVDLEPEPGSPAARREQRIREHPWRHAMIAATVAGARVVIPLLMGLLAVRFAVTLPWPQWNVTWPHIAMPHIPWPDIPWPDIHLPYWEPPQWARWVARALRYGWPVLLGLLVAKLEIERRREQDALKTELNREGDPVPNLDPATNADQNSPRLAPSASACR